MDFQKRPRQRNFQECLSYTEDTVLAQMIRQKKINLFSAISGKQKSESNSNWKMRRATEGPFVSSPDAKHAVLLQLWNIGHFQLSWPGTSFTLVTQNTCTGAHANQIFSRKQSVQTGFGYVCISSRQA